MMAQVTNKTISFRSAASGMVETPFNKIESFTRPDSGRAAVHIAGRDVVFVQADTAAQIMDDFFTANKALVPVRGDYGNLTHFVNPEAVKTTVQIEGRPAIIFQSNRVLPTREKMNDLRHSLKEHRLLLDCG